MCSMSRYGPSKRKDKFSHLNLPTSKKEAQWIWEAAFPTFGYIIPAHLPNELKSASFEKGPEKS